MSAPVFCYSRDGVEYHGHFDTREGALAEVVAGLEPGEEITVYTGEQRHALRWLRMWESSIGENAIEQMDEWLCDVIATDDVIVALDRGKFADLGKLILDFIEAHASFNRWGVEEIQEHPITVAEEGGAA